MAGTQASSHRKTPAWALRMVMDHTAQANLQYKTVPAGMLEQYTEDLVGMLLDGGEHWFMLYPEFKTCFMVVHQTDWVAEVHMFSEGGPWNVIKSARRFRDEVWAECDYTRIEWRVQEPVIKAIVEKAGYRVEGVRRKAWRSKTGEMVDEYMYAIIKGEKGEKSWV